MPSLVSSPPRAGDEDAIWPRRGLPACRIRAAGWASRSPCPPRTQSWEDRRRRRKSLGTQVPNRRGGWLGGRNHTAVRQTRKQQGQSCLHPAVQNLPSRRQRRYAPSGEFTSPVAGSLLVRCVAVLNAASCSWDPQRQHLLPTAEPLQGNTKAEAKSHKRCRGATETRSGHGSRSGIERPSCVGQRAFFQRLEWSRSFAGNVCTPLSRDEAEFSATPRTSRPAKPGDPWPPK